MGGLLSNSRPAAMSVHGEEFMNSELQEREVHNADWDTRSWLDYSYRRDINSVPSSLNSSWVNLDFVGPPHLLQAQGTSLGSSSDLGSSSEADTTTSPEATVSDGQPLTSTPFRKEESIKLSELTLEGAPVEGSMFHETASLQRSPLHWPPRPPGLHSPGHSLHSGASCVQSIIGEGSFTQSLTMSREKGVYISSLFQTHWFALVDQIKPTEVAQSLYSLAVLTNEELLVVTNTDREPSMVAGEIVKCLKKKLRAKPEIFSDVCAALSKSGVEVIRHIKAEVRARYPDDMDLTQSVSVFSKPELCSYPASCTYSVTSSSLSSQSTSHLEHVIQSLEDHVKNDRMSAAQQIVLREISRQNGVALLIESTRLDVSAKVLHTILNEMHSFNIHTRTEHNRTLLHFTCAALTFPEESTSHADLEALQRQQREKIVTLLRHGAMPADQDLDSNTAVHLAVLRGDTDSVELLLQHSPHCVHITNRVGNTPLHIATREGASDIVQLICSHGGNVRHPNKTREGKTPLHYACQWDCLPMVANLLSIEEPKSYVNRCDSNGDTPLHIAGRYGHKNIIKCLVSKGASKLIKNQVGKTPVEVCTQKSVTRLLNKKSPWLKRRRKRSTCSLRRFDTTESLSSTEGVFTDEERDETM